MASQIKKIDVLTVKLDAKPGALAQIYSAFRDAKVNVLESWAYEMGPGEAKAHFHAADSDKAKEALAKLGKQAKVEPVFLATGNDQIGVYHEVLDKIAK